MLQQVVVSDTKSPKLSHRRAALLYGSTAAEVSVELS